MTDASLLSLTELPTIRVGEDTHGRGHCRMWQGPTRVLGG